MDISCSGGWHTTRRGVTLARGIWRSAAREADHRVAAKDEGSRGKSSQCGGWGVRWTIRRLNSRVLGNTYRMHPRLSSLRAGVWRRVLYVVDSITFHIPLRCPPCKSTLHFEQKHREHGRNSQLTQLPSLFHTITFPLPTIVAIPVRGPSPPNHLLISSEGGFSRRARGSVPSIALYSKRSPDCPTILRKRSKEWPNLFGTLHV